MPRLQQAALVQITDVPAGGTFDHVDGEFQQANLPRIIDAVNHCAERLGGMFDLDLRACDYGVDESRTVLSVTSVLRN